MNTIIITNIPSPYRVFFFDNIALKYGGGFSVVYCSEIESNRSWDVPKLSHKATFLKKKTIRIFKRTLYFNPEIFKLLKKENPDNIIVGGFHPTMLFSVFYALFYKKNLFFTTDSWSLTERNLTWIHKRIRKLLYKKATGFFPVSLKGKENIISYGINPEQIHICPYIIDNEKYALSGISKQYDLMFSGQFIERKMPLFFVEVVKKIQKSYPDLKVLLVGNGDLNSVVIDNLIKGEVNHDYPGFVQPEDLPMYYNRTKLLLFPTQEDAWGVVANEALAASVPVITCENAGAAHELVIHDFNGFVLPLDVNVWAERILEALLDKERYSRLSMNCKSSIYTVNNSVEAFLKGLKN